MSKNLLWVGSLLDPSGYGEASRNYVCRLSAKPDFTIKAKPVYFWHGAPADISIALPTLKRLAATDFDFRKPYVYIQHLTPDNYQLGVGACKYQIGMTTFETDSVPYGWIGNMRAQDEIFTFSTFNKRVFEEVGIRRPITVIPHGVDVVTFNPNVEPYAPVESLIKATFKDKRPYIFGSNFDWTERKNPAALLRAYFSEFDASDDVCLVIKSFYQYPLSESTRYIKNYINDIKREFTGKKLPPVIVLTEMLSATQLPSLYKCMDCYVLPSRGEGWGLTYTEAMSMGLPCIAVKWSGHTDFMNDQNSILIDQYKLTEVTPTDAGGQRQYIGHKWASVDVDALACAMRAAYEAPDIGQSLGAQARSDMVSRWSWKSAVDSLSNRLDAIFQNL